MHFTESKMKYVTFPDSEVLKMNVYLPKRLEIYVDGAWSDLNSIRLGKGALIIYDWQNLRIRKFDSQLKQWSVVNNPIESLSDLLDVNLRNPLIHIAGFGQESGQWVMWEITKAKMHADFELL